MIFYKIFKIIALLRFSIRRPFLKKSALINYLYSFVDIIGYTRITLGKNNIIKKYAMINVDGTINNQYISISNSNVLESFSIIKSHGGYVEIGSNNFIGQRVQIQGRGGVKIGNHCMFAANVFISSSNHDFSNPESTDFLLKELPNKTILDDYIWIGANSIVLAGVTIGHHVVIGAGTIVNRDIPPYSVVVGNPCKVIKTFDLERKKWIKSNERQ